MSDFKLKPSLNCICWNRFQCGRSLGARFLPPSSIAVAVAARQDLITADLVKGKRARTINLFTASNSSSLLSIVHYTATQQHACKMQVELGHLTSWLHSLVERTEYGVAKSARYKYCRPKDPKLFMIRNYSWIKVLESEMNSSSTYWSPSVQYRAVPLKNRRLLLYQCDAKPNGTSESHYEKFSWLVDSWSRKNFDRIFPTTKSLCNHVED